MLNHDFLCAEFTILLRVVLESGDLEAGDRIKTLTEKLLFLSLWPDLSILSSSPFPDYIFQSQSLLVLFCFWACLLLWLDFTSFQSRKNGLLFPPLCVLYLLSQLTTVAVNHLIFLLNFVFCFSFMELLPSNYVIYTREFNLH